jgi:molybdenum cofactor sulfurtransferase
VTYIPLIPPDLRLDEAKLEEGLQLVKSAGNHLFAYPAQSNFSGVQHPLDWIERAQSMGWNVLLDGAAFTPTNRLDLRQWHPDFVDLSFYKIFGYPTGVGCLLARKATMGKLHRPWYAGGTITFSSVQGEGFYLTPGSAGYEDGTVNYLSLPAIEIGLRHIESIGIDTIHTRVMALAGWLLDELVELRHTNGRPVVRIYGPTDTHMRGATVEVNFFDPNGELFPDTHVEDMANDSNISLRAGCHCNPGAREISIGYTEDDLEACFKDKDRMTYDQFMHIIDGKTTGAVRASLGLVTNFADVYRYMQFAQTFVDRSAQ